jgi:23S rRNA (cytosine1962-C5)-methyltransferase
MESNDPFSPSQRRRLLLKPGRERAVRNRHPWIFEGAVRREEGNPDAAIADLVAPDGSLLASGFYSKQSQIRLRALTFGEPLERDGLRARVRRAVAARAALVNEDTTAVRLVNSEGDGLSGLVVDRYADTLVVEISCAGLDRIADEVIDELVAAASPVARVILSNDLPVRRLEGLSLESRTIDAGGGTAGEVVVLENGLRFVVAPGKGQKTGFFLDQRDNRLLARQLGAGRSVLNLFSFTGGFGVNAASGGATDVEEVDVSGPAMEMARRNHELNATRCPVSFVTADAFDRVRALRGERLFGLVIVDPPAFAKSRKDIDRAARGYKDIIMNALHLVEPGGAVMAFSCSGHVSIDLFQKIVFGAALDARRDVAILRRLGAGADHPVSVNCPEGEYLKGFLLRVG